MASSMASVLLQSSSFCNSLTKTIYRGNYGFITRNRRYPFSLIPKALAFQNNGLCRSFRDVKGTRKSLVLGRGELLIRFYSSKGSPGMNDPEKDSGVGWPILRRWDVPWKWQTVFLTMFACAISFVLTGLVETAVVPYLGFKLEDLSLDDKAELLFVDQFIVTAVILGVVYGFTGIFKPLPDDIFCYKLKDPFNLQNGWLLWAGVGLVGATLAITLTGAIQALLNGENPQRETDALVRLLPLIGSSSISTACLVGITGVLAPVLEETVFRGFLMVSLTKWVPTPVAVLLSAAVFAIAHLTPGEFPQLFILGRVFVCVCERESTLNQFVLVLWLQLIFFLEYDRSCFGVGLRSDSQSSYSNNNTCFLELRGDRSVNFPPGSRI
ncbi:hypothetical protein AMTRI_Chr04g190090 [Amborella trichopoda]